MRREGAWGRMRGLMWTDADLAAAFRDGDDRAFSILYDRYKRPLYAFAARMLSDPEAARDLVQDVFLKIHEKRRELHSPGSFRSWLFAIGRNGCISMLRRSREKTPLEQAPPEALAVGGSPESDLETEEDVRRVRWALARIQVEYREVLILREYQDLSYKEIAEVTRSTESAVKSRLFRARKALHDELKPTLAEGR